MATTPLHYRTISELSVQLAARQLSPVEVTRAMLDRIGELDGRPQSYATVTAEQALAAASRAEDEIAAGRLRGPLHGRADRGQGPLLHPRRAHDGRHGGARRARAERRRHGRGAARRGGRGPARQAEHDRGRDGRLPPGVQDPGQPVAGRPLRRGLVERLGPDRRSTAPEGR